MGRIRLFMYYTPVVEHFLRMAALEKQFAIDGGLIDENENN